MTYDEANPARFAAVPVTVPGQDRILARRRDLVVAVNSVCAYPRAVTFQLFIKTRFEDGESPNLAFKMPHLLQPGNFEFGTDIRDATGDWKSVEPNFAGGGGGGYGEPHGISTYEFKWWVSFSSDVQGFRLRCVWEERGVPESTAELDVRQLHEAARAAGPAWSDD